MKTFRVTQHDINVGVRGCAVSCPIACSLSDAFPKYRIRVEGTIIIGNASYGISK